MSAAETLSHARDMLVMTLLLVSPFLAVAIIACLVIGLIQASTRMNDLTLSFVPRFVAVLVLIYFSAAWAAGQATHYIERSAAAAVGIFR